MGWLWSSSSTDDANKPQNDAPNTEPSNERRWNLTEEQKQRIFGTSPSLRDGEQSREARDTQGDKALEELLNSLSESTPTNASWTPTKTTEPAQPDQRTDHDRILPDGTLNIAPMALYPRTMSCRQAFDAAFYCQSLGGKFNDIYRYGSLQSCSEHWGAFWFCMRTKSLPREERERQIQEHYAAREERRRREFGSSESVWEMRERPVERAFWKDPDADEEGGGMHVRE